MRYALRYQEIYNWIDGTLLMPVPLSHVHIQMPDAIRLLFENFGKLCKILRIQNSLYRLRTIFFHFFLSFSISFLGHFSQNRTNYFDI